MIEIYILVCVTIYFPVAQNLFYYSPHPSGIRGSRLYGAQQNNDNKRSLLLMLWGIGESCAGGRLFESQPLAQLILVKYALPSTAFYQMGNILTFPSPKFSSSD